MIFTSSLFFVLALSFTSASLQQGTVEEELTDKISSVVADKLLKVANNASTDNTSEAELDTMLLDTIRDILGQEMEPEIKALQYVSDDSPDEIAENLVLKISQKALPDDGKIAPRGLGSILGVLLRKGAEGLRKNKSLKEGGKFLVKAAIKAVLEEVAERQDHS